MLEIEKCKFLALKAHIDANLQSIQACDTEHVYKEEFDALLLLSAKWHGISVETLERDAYKTALRLLAKELKQKKEGGL